MIKNFFILLIVTTLFVSCGEESEVKENEQLTNIKEQIQYYRDSMKTAGIDHISFYSLEYVSHTENTEQENNDIIKKDSIAEENTIFTLGEFNSVAGDYVGKEIKVVGIVDHLCKHGGKKLLLVSDEGDTHVYAKNRFEDKLVGSEITVTGIVTEDRIDEAYLLKWEEDVINKHNSNDETNETDEN